MTLVDQFLQDISRHSDAVKKCTSPLHHLGVTCFYYALIKSNGEHVLLTNSPQTVEFYYEQSLYQKDPYLRHPDNYKSGFFLIEHFKKDDFDESLARVGKKFKTKPIVGLADKQEDYVEFFRFWGEGDKVQFDVANVQYANLLKAFAGHFKKECEKIIQLENSHFFSVKDLIGTKLFEHTKAPAHAIDAKSLRNFLTEIGFGEFVNKAEMLSPREQGCVKLLLKGKSIKETATTLELSPRTVEHYLENIKNKFNCQFKNELYVIAERLYEFGLI